MQSIVDLDLPILPVETPEFHRDPFKFTEEARRQHPWLGKYSQGYILYGYQACTDLARMDDKIQMTFDGVVDFYEADGTRWGNFMRSNLLTSSGDRHKRLRDAVAAGFTPRRANQIRPLIRQVISDLLDKWAPLGEFDFAEFAAQFPIAVMCGLLGISAEPIPGLRKAFDAHMASLNFDPSLKPVFLAGYDEIYSFADQVVTEREKRGLGDDGSELDSMIRAKLEGQIDETELRFLLMAFVLGGYDTSKNMLSVVMDLMIDKPDIWQKCADDYAYAGRVVEEMLRYCAVATLYRKVVVPFDYEGIHFPAGTMLTFAFPLSGRDPEAFANANAFDPDRERTTRHAAFGRGIHMCVGQYIARAQMQEGIHLIAQRIKRPRRQGDSIWKPFLGAWGLEALPIAFETTSPHPVAAV